MVPLSYDIIGHIIDILAGEGDLVPLKNTSLASSSVLHLCRRHIFRTIPFDNFYPGRKKPPKQPFITLLLNNPALVQYIRELNYEVHYNDERLSPVLPNLLHTISHLECLRIKSVLDNPIDWTEVDPSLRSALLRLMYLPTLTHLKIRRVYNLPLSALAPCTNIEHLDIHYIAFTQFQESELDLPLAVGCFKTPRVLQFSCGSSSKAVGRLLSAKWKDGRPLVDFTHLKSLLVDFDTVHAEINRNLFKSIEQLEKLSITVSLIPMFAPNLLGLAEMVSLSAHNLRTLEFTGPLKSKPNDLMLVGLCEELEILARYNVLEILNLQIIVDGCESKTFVVATFRRLEEVLMSTGWSALKRVEVEVVVKCCNATKGAQMLNLASVPELYLSRLSSWGILVYKFQPKLVYNL